MPVLGVSSLKWLQIKMISAGIVQQQLLFIRSFFIRIRSKRFLPFPLFLHSLFCPFSSPLHPATWHVMIMTLNSQVAVPCNVALARDSGMTCRWIRPNVRHIGILLPVLISTISPQSTCHPAPVCEIWFKSDRRWQKNDIMSIFEMADLRHLGF